MKPKLLKGVSENFLRYLLDAENRHEIETALAVDIMIANPDMEPCATYRLVMDIWSQMFIDRPVIEEPRANRRVLYAKVHLFMPEGETFPMRIEVRNGALRLRSVRANASVRDAMMARWKATVFPPATLKAVSRNHRDGRKRAATIKA